MASLRFKYGGEKRKEQGGSRSRPFRYSEVMPIPPDDIEISYRKTRAIYNEPIQQTIVIPENNIVQEEQPEVVICAEEARKEEQLPEQMDISGGKDISEEKAAPTDEIVEEPEGAAISASEKFIASLDSYENGIVKINEQLDKGKIIFDEVIFYLDSLLKILEIIKENEVRKKQEPQVSFKIEKTNKDTIDQILELLQTPTFQSILRQILIGLLVKK